MFTYSEVVLFYPKDDSVIDIETKLSMGIGSLLKRFEDKPQFQFPVIENENMFAGVFTDIVSGKDISYYAWYVENHPYFKDHFRFELFICSEY